MGKTSNIAIIPSPGFSHLVPVVEFSKRLISLHPNFHVTCIIPSIDSPPDSSKSYLQTIPSNINSIFLPPINKQDLPKEPHPGIQIQHTLTLSLPSIHKALKSLSSKAPLVAMVVDAFAIQALDFAKEFNSLTYVYISGSAMVLSHIFHLPKLDEEVSCEYKDLTQPINLPGCVPIMGRDLLAPTKKRSSEAFRSFVEKTQKMSYGVLFNSFLEMEPDAIKALEEAGKQIYPVGPITQHGSSNLGDKNECLKWLDKQAQCSVLYVSFGSGGTLSQGQIYEIALGLELSGDKFLWVVREPSDSVNAAYLEAGNEDPLKFLPSGFLERTKEKGFVVASWAPQVEVLRHSSIGGFLSHCGWNSVLESVQGGVPIIAWPLFAEQAMNAVLLTDGLKVALRLKFDNDEIVGKEEIGRMVKRVMDGEEGKEMRNRMKSLKDNAAKALMKDGSSTQTLSRLASQWESLCGV